MDEKHDESLNKQSFANQELYRLAHKPHLTRRHIAGVLKYRNEKEGDEEPAVKAFLKSHQSGFFSSNFFC